MREEWRTPAQDQRTGDVERRGVRPNMTGDQDHHTLTPPATTPGGGTSTPLVGIKRTTIEHVAAAAVEAYIHSGGPEPDAELVVLLAGHEETYLSLLAKITRLLMDRPGFDYPGDPADCAQAAAMQIAHLVASNPHGLLGGSQASELLVTAAALADVLETIRSTLAHSLG
jgi:hypothetical protein